MAKLTSACCALALAIPCVVGGAEVTGSWQTGKVELTSAGPLAFAPDGVLLVSDPMAATIYAIATGDNSGDPSTVDVGVKDLKSKVASMLGSEAQDVRISDLSVNPASGNIYLAVARGSGPESATAILRVDVEGQLSEVGLEDVRYMKASLPNPPESQQTRRGDARMLAITDMAYADGRVFIAGLSNEEFASKLRAIPFPFEDVNAGTSVEIYHGAHGAVETRSPIMTFATYEIADQPHVVGAYTCTPLVKFPLSDLQPGVKVRGTTVAELGNRNRPLDMFVYEQDGKNYILLANDSRGVMKISTESIDDIEGINERISGTAGLPYDTISELTGVAQLDRLNDGHAVALIVTDDGTEDLRTIELP